MECSLLNCLFFLDPATNMSATSDSCFWLVPIRNKKYLWWPCLLTDRNEISYLNRTPSIDASYQDVSAHLAKQLQRRYLEIDQSETRMACGSHVY
jgi:hypothetical protein